jgi:hypothetical protein
MTYQKSFSLLKNMFFAFAAICFFASCQDEEIIGTSESAQTAAVSTDESNVASLTISGENTELAEVVECTSCTYVVDANAETIDGEVLGLKPGNVICLNQALKYGNLSFINLQGTAENPILIAKTRIVKN